MNYSFEEKMETIADESAIGTIVDATAHAIVKRWAQGEIGGILNVNCVSLALYALFGSVSSAVDTGTAYKHTFTLSNSNQSPSLTIAMDDSAQDYRFALSVIQKLTLKVEPGKYVEVTMDFVGKKGTSSSNTPAFVADYPLKAGSVSMVFATNLAGLSGATSTACVKNLEITFERTIAHEDCIASIEPTDFISTVFAVSGSFEATYEDEATYKTLALAGTTKAMRIDMLDGNTIIGGATSSPDLQIDLAKVAFMEWSRTVSTNEVVTQSVGFKGLYSISDAQAVVARLTNTVTSI